MEPITDILYPIHHGTWDTPGQGVCMGQTTIGKDEPSRVQYFPDYIYSWDYLSSIGYKHLSKRCPQRQIIPFMVPKSIWKVYPSPQVRISPSMLCISHTVCIPVGCTHSKGTMHTVHNMEIRTSVVCRMVIGIYFYLPCWHSLGTKDRGWEGTLPTWYIRQKDIDGANNRHPIPHTPWYMGHPWVGCLYGVDHYREG